MQGEVSNLLVVGMGVGVVFFGLICLIAVCYLVSFFSRSRGEEPVKAAEPVAAAAPAGIPNRQELVAAISVAVAIDMGTDPSALRIVSLKKL